MAIYARLWRTRIGATEDSRENRHSRCDGKNSRPGDQDSDEVLKGTPWPETNLKKRPPDSRVARNSTAGARTQQTNSTIKSFRASPGVARRCAMVDTLNIQSVTPSTHHQAGLDFRPRDSTSEPGSPALERSPVVSPVHAAAAHVPTVGATPRGSEGSSR